MAPRVLYIGLGNIGRGMSKNLVEKSNLDQPLLLFNRSIHRSIDLQAKLGADKTEVVKSVAEGVAKAEVIFMCLSNDDVVDATVADILNTDVKGKLIIDCTTVRPDTSNKIGQRVEAAGADFVAAPVFGAAPMAEAGKLVIAVAGPEAAVQRTKPYLQDVTARDIIDMSGRAWGTSTTLKLVGSTYISNMVEQVAYSLVLAEKSGLGTENVRKWVNLVFPGPYGYYADRMLSGNYYNFDYPPAPVVLGTKDVVHAMELAQTSGVEMPMLKLTLDHLEEVKELRGDKGDVAGIYGVLRMKAGLKFENQE